MTTFQAGQAMTAARLDTLILTSRNGFSCRYGIHPTLGRVVLLHSCLM
jgi:hypothetical protein